MAIELIDTKAEMLAAAVKENLTVAGKKKNKTSLLDDAIEVIRDATAAGHRFETKEMDVFVEAMLHVLPPHEREWFREIATMNLVPLWQALWAQYRRANELSMAPSLILDPDWEAYGVRDLGTLHCELCNEPFEPIAMGQRWCSNRCGGKAEMAAKRAAEAVVEESKHGDTV